jgi:hypothetical protein
VCLEIAKPAQACLEDVFATPKPRIGDADKATRMLPTKFIAERLGEDVGTRAQCGLNIETTAWRAKDLGELRHPFPWVRGAVARVTVASPSSTQISTWLSAERHLPKREGGQPGGSHTNIDRDQLACN